MAPFLFIVGSILIISYPFTFLVQYKLSWPHLLLNCDLLANLAPLSALAPLYVMCKLLKLYSTLTKSSWVLISHVQSETVAVSLSLFEHGMTPMCPEFVDGWTLTVTIMAISLHLSGTHMRWIAYKRGHCISQPYQNLLLVIWLVQWQFCSHQAG